MRATRLAIALAAFVLLGSACASISKPDGWAPPEAVEDALYVSLDGGEISALDATSYAELWKFPAVDEFACGSDSPQSRDLEGIYGAPAFDDESLYVGAYDGAVYAVTREDGTCLWRFKTDDPIIGATVLGEAGLYVPSTDGVLYLLDPETGDEVDSFAAGDIWSTPLLTEDALYAATMEGQLWKLDPATLEPVWDAPFDVGSGLLTDPVLAGDDTVVVGGIGEDLYGIDTATGDEKWSVTGSNWFWGTPAVDGATLYATTMAGQVIAIDGATGEKTWERKADDPIRAGAVLVDGVVVAVDKGGRVYRFGEGGEAMGEPIRLDKEVFATPLARDGAVLILSTGGDVYEVTTADGRTTKVVD